MLKEQGSEAGCRELRSRRERELEELRSRGVAKTRREKLKYYSTPLQTALESKRFLLACHDQSKKEQSFGQPKWNPSTVSAVDYNSFLMQQSKRQRELKMRRREAEQLLHGFRGFYGESFASWSPRHAKKEQNGSGLFGFPAEDTLRDPEDDSSRRHSTAFDWGEAEERDDSQRNAATRAFSPNPLDPNIGDFLVDGRHYDGTKYSRTNQDMEVASGVVMFSPRADGRPDNQFRERPPSTTRSSTSAARQAFFDDPSNYAGGVFGEDFEVGFDGNEFRERPLSTTRSSRSGRKVFFQDPKNVSGGNFESDADGFAVGFDRKNNNSDRLEGHGREPAPLSPYEPRRMKLRTPTSSVSSVNFDRTTPDGFPVGFDSNSRKGEQSSDDPEDREPATSTPPYEARRMNLHDQSDPSGHFDRTPSSANFHRTASSGQFDRTPDGFPLGLDGNTQKEVRHRFDPDAPKVTSDETEAHEADEYASYKAQRMQLQINTEREDVIDITHSEERLREAEDEIGGSWREERQGILNTSVEDIAASPTLRVDNTRRVDKQLPKNLEQAVLHKQKSVPVPAPLPETIWRDFVSDEPGARFPPEAGRYHLYASYACPGSHRALIVRALKGLEDIISVTIVHPTWRHTNPENPKDKHRGWIFGDPDGKPFHNTMGRGGPFPSAYPDTSPDPVLNAYSVRNLYEYAQDTSGKYTIPLLWDTKLNTIVNNESSDISYMLNSCFNKFAQNPAMDLYTEDDDDGLDRLNEVSQWLYPMMIHGVYRCGFAKTQRAYDEAIEELTVAFDAADELLQQQRYLTGDTLTDADIRFFVTLLRFDEVYAFYFRANTRLVLMTPSLLNFCREIYQMPGVASTCQMDQIKAHFFGSHAEWNKYSVVPRGLDFMRYLEMPHDRENIAAFGHC